jgi:hypothetical protein
MSRSKFAARHETCHTWDDEAHTHSADTRSLAMHVHKNDK